MFRWLRNLWGPKYIYKCLPYVKKDLQVDSGTLDHLFLTPGWSFFKEELLETIEVLRDELEMSLKADERYLGFIMGQLAAARGLLAWEEEIHEALKAEAEQREFEVDNAKKLKDKIITKINLTTERGK